MSEHQSKSSPLAYVGQLTGGSRAVLFPGLVCAPSLDATLRLHREYKARITRDIDHDWDGNVVQDETYVAWGPANEDMSHALLVASEIVREIEKGLGILGIDWKPALKGEFLPQSPEELPTISCPPRFAVPEVEFDMTIRQAVELLCFFSGLGNDWVVEEVHAYAEACVDEKEAIYVTTMDDWYLSCPVLPWITGLRDWDDVSDELEQEGYHFDCAALVEDCFYVMTGIVERILEREAGH